MAIPKRFTSAKVIAGFAKSRNNEPPFFCVSPRGCFYTSCNIPINGILFNARCM
jgi:hypothetical protein